MESVWTIGENEESQSGGGRKMKVTKPWGSYVDHYRTDTMVRKTIHVNPNSRLSLQKHEKRAETWLIESGAPEIEINGKVFFGIPGEYYHIEVGDIHRLSNPTNSEVTITEIQVGECSEDDIVRLEDDYNRTS